MVNLRPFATSTQPSHSLRGFTIVELLIVIVVIATLAAIAIVAYNGIQNSSKNSAVRSDIRVLSHALELYRAENGSLPQSSTELNTFMTGTPDAALNKVLSAHYNGKSGLYAQVPNASIPGGIDYNIVVAVERNSDTYVIIANTAFNGVYFSNKDKQVSINPFAWSTNASTLLITNAGLVSPVVYIRYAAVHAP